MKFRFLLIAGLVALAAACGDSTGPGKEPEVTNTPDNFLLQFSNLSNVTRNLQYTWPNSGTLANVTHSPSVGATGTATLIIRDNAGTEVYRRDLKVDGTFVSSPAGTAGSWTIRVEISNFTGTINFHVQKGG